ncbi:hypothetical protein GCM10007049_27910 [Echinicola pacifica]|uniref:DUF502 domain-containing protein n=1 Tax=Echinicola pacifica TaxID=346377 RepID=A0A918Q5J7_9BACT|nr:DUF502 domain-containing protein [Echinicola pacifica]GGZ32762.1 hypothetical protein GCM10007049_27910 [Echinicola pacifica]
MKVFLNFVNKTLKGGLFFILPLMLSIVLLEKVLHIIQPVAYKSSHWLHPDQEKVLDFSYVLAVVILVVVCFFMGLVASSAIGAGMIAWIENNILTMFPAYRLMKSTFQSAAGIRDGDHLPVVLVPMDGLVLGFLVEELPDGDKLIFVPGSPDPWSGNLIIYKDSQVKHTSLTQPEALKILKQTGIGVKDKLLSGIYQNQVK